MKCRVSKLRDISKKRFSRIKTWIFIEEVFKFQNACEACFDTGILQNTFTSFVCTFMIIILMQEMPFKANSVRECII